jgi:hypothetical protein
MAFTVKSWANGRENGALARWNAAAAIDMETRLAAYTDSQVAGSFEIVNRGTILANDTLDMTNSLSVLWIVTLGASNIKLEINGWSAGDSVLLIVKQDATGNRTLTGLPTAKWDGGAIPGQTLAPNGIDIRSFFHDGTHAYGSEYGTAMA